MPVPYRTCVSMCLCIAFPLLLTTSDSAYSFSKCSIICGDDNFLLDVVYMRNKLIGQFFVISPSLSVFGVCVWGGGAQWTV